MRGIVVLAGAVIGIAGCEKVEPTAFNLCLVICDGPCSSRGSSVDARPALTRHEPSPPPSARDRLEPAELQAGLREILPTAARCAPRLGSGGLIAVPVSITINPDGTVAAVAPLGGHAATPLGACVAQAVRSARFPAFTGSPMTFSYHVRVGPGSGR